MIPALDDLSIAELGRLILHEAHDGERLARVRSRIEAEGIQRNPIIVSPFDENFLVLDGAHRVHALRDLDARLALVQILDPPPRAESWAHLVPSSLAEKLNEAPDLDVSTEGAEDTGDGWLAKVEVHGGDISYVRAREDGFPAQMRALRAIQDAYPKNSEVRRVGPDETTSRNDGAAIVRYRTFSPEELVEVVHCGCTLPAGITRFRVEERVLGVRFPLESLRAKDTVSPNAELKNLIETRWRENRVRRYAEPVVLFE